MKGTVYCIREISTKEVLYVGSTKQKIVRRIYNHMHNCFAKQSDFKIYEYIRSKTDKENFGKFFAFEVLETLDTEDMSEIRIKEREYVERLSPSLNVRKPYLYGSEKVNYCKDYCREWYKLNREKHKAYMREQYKTEEFKEYNRNYHREYMRRKRLEKANQKPENDI